MFDKIEKAYRKDLLERRLWKFYRKPVVVVLVLSLIMLYIMKWNYWAILAFVAAFLIVCVIWFFVDDYRRLMRNSSKRGLKAYFAEDDLIRRRDLWQNLKQCHVTSKDDVKLCLQHFQQKVPTAPKPNWLDVTMSIFVTLVSVIVVAYDRDLQTVDFTKLRVLFDTVIQVAVPILVILSPILIVYIAMASHRSKVDSVLADDLAYLYINFEKL